MTQSLKRICILGEWKRGELEKLQAISRGSIYNGAREYGRC
jgi:hypothetical protein